jgi:purine-nucleoside phosphorylase
MHPSSSIVEQVDQAAAVVRGRVSAVPDVAIVLGSGLGDFAEHLQDAVAFPYAELPNWPVSGVVGHAGKLVIGRRAGKLVAALSGRAHFYEGHPMAAVTFAVRAMARLGVRVLLLTNAAGGINTSFQSGALMVIDDHINLLGTNPLIGPNDDSLGPRFPDMTEVYSGRLRALADSVAAVTGIPLAHGVYVAVTGPSYETPAEIRFFRKAGADAVGMSTVPEALVARHMGIEVLGLSCITNMAAGVLPQPLVHDEVMATAHRVRADFTRLLDGIIERL